MIISRSATQTNPSWTLMSRIEEWQRTIVQCAMGWNHHCGEEATRPGNSGYFLLPSASTIGTAKAIAVSEHSRYCSKIESRDYTRLKHLVVRYLERKTHEKHVCSCERQVEKPASGAAAAKGKCKGKETVDIAYNGQPKVNALEKLSVE